MRNRHNWITMRKEQVTRGVFSFITNFSLYFIALSLAIFCIGYVAYIVNLLDKPLGLTDFKDKYYIIIAGSFGIAAKPFIKKLLR
ncbi:MAG: hypothetical protein CMF14_06450 [Idiomarina sp.]|nr:hypothetical protein [Idiomarina sp.]MBE92533.1 hypothetical protein [Idiomarina sp.]